jgi:hypothetical protein
MTPLTSAYEISLPLNFDAGPLLLRSAPVRPFTVLTRGDERHHVFFSIAGMVPEFVWVGSPAIGGDGIEVTQKDGLTTVRGRYDAPYLVDIPAARIPTFAKGRRVTSRSMACRLRSNTRRPSPFPTTADVR